MTDLLIILPSFPAGSYTHLLPSLERSLITTMDLISLDATEVAKRAQLPVLDIRRLANAIVAELRSSMGLSTTPQMGPQLAETSKEQKTLLRKTGRDLIDGWSTISTLDEKLDAILGGGIPPGYITEITGERYGRPGLSSAVQCSFIQLINHHHQVEQAKRNFY